MKIIEVTSPPTYSVEMTEEDVIRLGHISYHNEPTLTHHGTFYDALTEVLQRRARDWGLT